MKNNNFQKGSAGIIISIVILALILVGVIYLTNNNKETQEMATETEEEMTGEQTNGQEEQIEMMTEESIISILTENSNTQQALLVAVDGSDSAGIGLRLAKEGKLYHSVIAQMPDPAENNFYEGWLVQITPLQFISTGDLVKDVEGQWVLEFSANQEYPSYTRVVITEETVKDATPETHIIEGDF